MSATRVSRTGVGPARSIGVDLVVTVFFVIVIVVFKVVGIVS